MDKDREKKVKERLSTMSREDLEKYAFDMLNSKASELLSNEARNEIDKSINDVIKDHLIDRVNETKFIDKLLYQTDYNGNINYNAVQTRFNDLIVKFLEQEGSLKEEFKNKMIETINNNIDNLIRNVVFRIFMNGIAKDVITTDMFRDAIDEHNY